MVGGMAVGRKKRSRRLLGGRRGPDCCWEDEESWLLRERVKSSIDWRVEAKCETVE